MPTMPSVPPYDPRSWYWTAADGRIYSGGRNALVFGTDPGYLAFTQTVGGTTPWPADTSGAQTAAALQEVLTPYGIVLPFS
jgi:hypothetical protein